MQQDHFNRYFRLQFGPVEGSVVDAHHMFDLTSASGGGIPLSRYVELDVECFRATSAKGWIPDYIQNPNEGVGPMNIELDCPEYWVGTW